MANNDWNFEFGTLDLTPRWRLTFAAGSRPQPVPSPSPLPTPEIRTVSPPPDNDDDDGDATETERDLDVAPAFPSLDSAQRAQTSTIPKILSDAALMPPPPLPQLAVRTPGVARASSSLAVPPTTTKPPVRASAKERKGGSSSRTQPA